MLQIEEARLKLNLLRRAKLHETTVIVQELLRRDDGVTLSWQLFDLNALSSTNGRGRHAGRNHRDDRYDPGSVGKTRHEPSKAAHALVVHCH